MNPPGNSFPARPCRKYNKGELGRLTMEGFLEEVKLSLLWFPYPAKISPEE
jgi:hypothetical protein